MGVCQPQWVRPEKVLGRLWQGSFVWIVGESVCYTLGLCPVVVIYWGGGGLRWLATSGAGLGQLSGTGLGCLSSSAQRLSGVGVGEREGSSLLTWGWWW